MIKRYIKALRAIAFRLLAPASLTSVAILAPFGSAAKAACAFTIASDADIAWLSSNYWYWNANIPAGSNVCIAAGDYTQMLTVLYSNNGNASQPVVISPASPSSVVRLMGGVNIRASSHVILADIANVSAPHTILAAILIDQGSHHVTVANNAVQDSQFGIVLGSSAAGGLGGPAGIGNLVENNIVQENLLGGIVVGNGSHGKDLASGTIEFNRIRLNTVQYNGGHGIDVDNSSYAYIEKNLVRANGMGNAEGSTGGYSGIHMLANLDLPGRCTGNIVRYNTVLDTRERPANQQCDDLSGSGRCVDGNGIQIDRFCDANEVSFNVSKGNAGSGVHIFAGSNNDVHSNTVHGNNKQSARLAVYGATMVGEIMVSTNVEGRSVGNKIYDNIAWATTKKTPGINVHASTNGSGNAVGPNMIHNAELSSTWAAFMQVGVPTNDPLAIDAMTGTVGSHVAKPIFLNVNLPEADGLQLTAKPAKAGKKPAPLIVDKLGLLPPATKPTYFGAYYR